MDIGRKAKSRTPACIQADCHLELFRIKWVEKDLDYKPHLHCAVCGITAKDALPKKMAEAFNGYDDPPEELQKCEVCGEWFAVEFSNLVCVCDDCAIYQYPCAACGDHTAVEHLGDDSCCGSCSAYR